MTDAVQLTRIRKKLARSYELVSEYRCNANGYGNATKNILTTISYATKLLEYQFLPHYFGEPPGWRIFLRKLKGNRTLPDFCVIGPIKSGTSDLAVDLMLHPNIMTPFAKEFYIADPEEWRIFYPTEYQRKQHTNRHGLALCPYFGPYLHWMELIFKLSRLKPNIKIVLILRDPVKRLYSHWKWEILITGLKNTLELPFLQSFSAYVEKALTAFPELPMYSACEAEPLQTGIYWKAVKNWIDYFGSNNVIILDIGEYFINKNKFLNNIFNFVGLPGFDYPAFIDKINENPISLPKPDLESLSKLSEFYEPYNRNLWILLGKKFEWC